MKDPKKSLWWADTASFVDWILYAVSITGFLWYIIKGESKGGDGEMLAGWLAMIWLSLLRVRLLIRSMRMDSLRREIATADQVPRNPYQR